MKHFKLVDSHHFYADDEPSAGLTCGAEWPALKKGTT